MHGIRLEIGGFCVSYHFFLFRNPNIYKGFKNKLKIIKNKLGLY